MSAITVKNVTVYHQDHIVLQNISCSIPEGVLLAIVGPNGAGKTTFIKSLIGMHKPTDGAIHFFDNKKSSDINIAYIPQRSHVDWDFPVTVEEVVMMGCYRELGWFRRPSKMHWARVYQALEKVDMCAYKNKPIGQLSGGQQQRVFLARALMQQAEIYLMDEPFVGLDVMSEKMMVTFLKELCMQGKTVCVVHHDLQTLADYFDWALLLNTRSIACGPIKEVCAPEFICKAYGAPSLYVPKSVG